MRKSETGTLSTSNTASAVGLEVGFWARHSLFLNFTLLGLGRKELLGFWGEGFYTDQGRLYSCLCRRCLPTLQSQDDLFRPLLWHVCHRSLIDEVCSFRGIASSRMPHITHSEIRPTWIDCDDMDSITTLAPNPSANQTESHRLAILLLPVVEVIPITTPSFLCYCLRSAHQKFKVFINLVIDTSIIR